MQKHTLLKIFKSIIIFGILLIIIWVGDYSNRSYRGSYHEHVMPGGISIAVWHPTDFTPRRPAPERPLDARPSRRRGRYAPQTQLPQKRYFDLPLLMIDRWVFHPTTQIQSGQGDMPYVYRLSSDGRDLIPVEEP
jgi:hypothetical protein